MSRPHYYSPRISRPLITCLYHEAKRRGIPMTTLVDQIIESSLGANRTMVVSESDATSKTVTNPEGNWNEV